MTRVLHILPHPGGGGERYVDMLFELDGVQSARIHLGGARTLGAAIPGIAGGYPLNARRARGADLRHAHGDAAAILALPLLSAPSVWTTHGLHLLRRATGTRRGAAERAVAAVVRRCERTICCSEAERDELAAFLPAPLTSRLVVIPNGVDAPAPAPPSERAAIRAELELPRDATAVLYLGELEERKDPRTAVVAAMRARERGADAILLVAGDGPLRAELEELAARAVLAAARPGAAAPAGAGPVRILGFRSDPGRLLAAADAFCMPSEREGLSFAVLEAMAAGLPTIVSDSPGNAEAVAGGAGLAFPHGDAEALALAIERLAAEPAERERLGAAARARAADRFTRARMLAAIGALYAEVVPRC